MNVTRLYRMFLFGLLGISTDAMAIPPYPDNFSIKCQTTAALYFTPNYGVIDIGEDEYGRYVQHWLWWQYDNRTSALKYYSDSALEPDVIFKAWYTSPYGERPSGVWSSELPAPYQDTNAWFDGGDEKPVTVGSNDADKIAAGRLYYTFTRIQTGGSDESEFKIQIQRGREGRPCWPPRPQIPTNCVFSCRQDANNVKIFDWNTEMKAPGCYRFWYKYYLAGRLVVPTPRPEYC